MTSIHENVPNYYLLDLTIKKGLSSLNIKTCNKNFILNAGILNGGVPVNSDLGLARLLFQKALGPT